MLLDPGTAQAWPTMGSIRAPLMEGADLAHLGLLGLASLLKNGVLRRYAKHAGSPSDPERYANSHVFTNRPTHTSYGAPQQRAALPVSYGY